MSESKEKKKLIVVLSIVIALAIIAIAAFIIYSNTPNQRVTRQLNLGNRYLSELDYERAIACYEIVISIDCQEIEAYKGLSECYNGLNDPDGLLDLYYDAYNVLSDSEADLVTKWVAGSLEDMLAEEIQAEHYEDACELINYLKYIDKERYEVQLIALNDEMCKALGHVWNEATCTEPRMCSRCGHTEGNPVGHVPTEADYWNPSVCSVCGEELSPVLIPYFVQCHYSPMEDDRSYRYYTTTKDGNLIGANIKISNYEVISGCDVWDGPRRGVTINDLEWEMPEKDGYEWRIVTIDFKFFQTYAYSFCGGLALSGYYEGLSGDEYAAKADPIGMDTVVFDGKEYEVTYMTDLGISDWGYDGSILCDMTFAVQVPKGYEGVVVYLFNRSVSDKPVVDIWNDVDTFFVLMQ